MTLIRLWACAVGAALLSGCVSTDYVAEQSVLVGPTWTLVGINEGGAATELPQAQAGKYSLRFMGDGTLNVQLDCNAGRANWSARSLERALSIGPIASSRAMCPDMSISNRLTRGLPEADSYGFTDDENTLVIEAGATTFSFRR